MHTITRHDALKYARKIVETSGFGIRGKTELFGNLVVSKYTHGPLTASLLVSLEPTVEVYLELETSKGENADRQVELAIQYQENVKSHLETAFQLWNIAAS